MTNYVRNNAWNNGGNFSNQDVLWYARAVKRMMSRSLDDPASWWFFAAIHGEYVNPKTAWYVNPPAFPDWSFIQSPPGVPSAPLPTQGVQDLYWNQCQHGSWYFLPWHRGYLLALEAQLRADVVSLGGPSTWALPYWDYFGVNGPQYGMPPAFAEATLDGDVNPLYVAMRYGPQGNGNIYIPTTAWEAANPQGSTPYGVVTDACLLNDVYTGSDQRTPPPGFGGPDTGFSHSGRVHGNMESNPHDLVHVYVGGVLTDSDYGLMADPGTAALDPIFYLHHSNIDRMWAAWNASGNSNPTDADWLNGPPRSFVMPWPGGKPWYYTPMQMGNLRELNYTYEDLSAVARPAASPLAARLTRLGAIDAAKSVNEGLATVSLSSRSELLGSSTSPIAVVGAGVSGISVKMDGGVRRKLVNSLRASSAAALPDQVYLKLENVRGAMDATVLGVYVNLQDAGSPAQRRASFVGDVALFGLRRASVPGGEHGGDGLTFLLDITRVVDELHLQNSLDVGSIDVSLLPRRPLPGSERVTVDRVSVFRQGN